MRILFVESDIYLFERFGIMYISKMLKNHGHQVDIIRTRSENIHAKIKSFRPNILAYGLTTGFHQYFIDLNRELKKKYDVLSIFGGSHPTFFPDVIKEQGADIVCIGEGEFPMLELANALQDGKPIEDIENFVVKTNGKIKYNPTRNLIGDLDILPFPDRELLYQNNPVFKNMKIKAFFSGRGCPYKCTYCFNHIYNKLFRDKGRVVRKRSVDNLIEEISMVKANYPLKVVRFMDDVFTLGGKAWIEEFSKKYRKNIGLPFVCMTRADIVDEEIVRMLKEANCHSVYMAIEAGNDYIRNVLLKRNLTKERMIQASNLFHKHGIKIVAENMLGLPSETMKDMFETLNLNVKCNIDLALVSIFNPYRGTELAKFAKENGYFSGDYDKIGFSMYNDSPLNFSENQKNKIRNLRQLFAITVNFPILLPLAKILINLPSNPIFAFISELWHGYGLKVKIFPHRWTLKDYIRYIPMYILSVKRTKA